MSSRLFQRIREDLGMAYTIYTYSGAYSHIGCLNLYVGTNPENGETVILDFEGVSQFASPFFNFAIGQLLKDIAEDDLRRLLQIDHLNETGRLVVERVIENAAKYHGDKARWVVDAWTETWLSPAFAHWSVQAALPHIHCPVLAMHGELDEYGTPEHPQRIASGVRGPAQAVIIPGAHHMPHREMPALVIQQVATFLAPLAA